MSELRIRIGITGNARQKLRAIGQEARAAVLVEMQEIMNDLWSRATKRAPIRTGHLRRTIGPPEVRDRRTAIEFTLGARAIYARAVEEGTGPHLIRPRRAKALRFIGADGKPVFAQSVRHPGTRAKPFMEPALAEIKPTVRERLSQAIQRLISRS